MDKLIFKSTPALIKLARQTLIKDEFRIPYIEGKWSEKSFTLVKDSGIYVMNSFDLEDGTPETEGLCAYAEGYDPKTNVNCWDDTYLISADDFAESLPMFEGQLARLSEGGDLIVYLYDDKIKIEA
jgi:hypothetical protein